MRPSRRRVVLVSRADGYAAAGASPAGTRQHAAAVAASSGARFSR
jgi:hypothetical protein